MVPPGPLLFALRNRSFLDPGRDLGNHHHSHEVSLLPTQTAMTGHLLDLYRLPPRALHRSNFLLSTFERLHATSIFGQVVPVFSYYLHGSRIDSREIEKLVDVGPFLPPHQFVGIIHLIAYCISAFSPVLYRAFRVKRPFSFFWWMIFFSASCSLACRLKVVPLLPRVCLL